MTIVEFFATIEPSSLLILLIVQVSLSETGLPELVVATPAILVNTAGVSAFTLKVNSSTMEPVVETLLSINSDLAAAVR